MKKAIKLFLLGIFISITLYTCDDILEEDISNDIVNIIAPSNAIIQGNTTQFSWETLDGADDYRLQVLLNNQQIIIDSLVTTNELSLNLNPGNYLWRIKGKNFAYQTEYTFPINFSVEVSEDLTSQSVILETPSDNFYTNTSSMIVNWTPMINANSYDIEVLKINSGQVTIYQESDIVTTSVTLASSLLNDDAEYLWKVKAKNTVSETQFAERSFFTDRVVPNQPSLNSPDDASTNTVTVTFNWSNGSDTGDVQSSIINTLEIASDANFNTIINTFETENNTYQYTFSTIGDYYWRVRAIDLANNNSDYSNVRTLTIE